jgi:hypothetical protein
MVVIDRQTSPVNRLRSTERADTLLPLDQLFVLLKTEFVEMLQSSLETNSLPGIGLGVVKRLLSLTTTTQREITLVCRVPVELGERLGLITSSTVLHSTHIRGKPPDITTAWGLPCSSEPDVRVTAWCP